MRPSRSAMRVAALLSLAAAAACGGGSSSSTSSGSSSQESSSPTPTATATAPPVPTSPAPVIVQVENLPDARPQSGFNSAPLAYEYETEGGISRFSLLFFAAPSTAVGPVRSARLATVKLVKIYDATLLYSGASQYVTRQLGTGGIRSYSEGGGFTYRVNSRPAPHNLYANGVGIGRLMAKVGALTVPWTLWARTPVTALPVGGLPGSHVVVPVSASEVPTFNYDPASMTYTRTEPGTGLMKDAATGQPWRIGTVIVMHVPVTVGPEVEDVSGTHGLDFGIVGSGSADVATGGFLFHAAFNQPDSGPPVLTLASGAPAPIADGPVLIVLARPTATVKAT